MPDFSVEDDGEWTFEGGDFVLVEGAEEVRQDVRVVLGLTKNEVQFDREAGLDPEVIFAAGSDQARIAGEYRDVILSRPGIVSCETPVVGPLLPDRSVSLHYTAQYSLPDLAQRGPVADKFTIKV